MWSLLTGAATYIQFPVHPDRGIAFAHFLNLLTYMVSMAGYAFRPDGCYFLLAERHKSKDTLGVYDTTNSYKLVRVCITILTSRLSPQLWLALPTPDSLIILAITFTYWG